MKNVLVQNKGRKEDVCGAAIELGVAKKAKREVKPEIKIENGMEIALLR